MDPDDEQLIDLVQQYSHIWRKTHHLFKDKNAKKNAWQTIGSILETTGEQNKMCKKVNSKV